MNWLTCHRQLLRFAQANETLTLSQVSTRNAILNAVKIREKYINLWGTAGVGKTFLAHSLHHHAGLVYYSDRTHYDAQVCSDSVVAIDNATYARQEARQLYDKIRWGKKDYTGPTSVILITREPIDDAVHHIELTLTDTDIVHMENLIQQQFGKCDFELVSRYVRQRSGLWRYVKTLAQRTQ